MASINDPGSGANVQEAQEVTYIANGEEISEGTVMQQMLLQIGEDQHVLMLQPISLADFEDNINHETAASQGNQLQFVQVKGSSGESEGQTVLTELPASKVSSLVQQALLQARTNAIVEETLAKAKVQPDASTSTGEASKGFPNQRQEPALEKPIGPGPYPCEVCHLEFSKWKLKVRHEKSHAEDKPHRCTECSETFNHQENLTLHLATHTTNGSPQCPECGKRFTRIASFKAHILIHQKEESLMCVECGDEFALQSQLDKHMIEHREDDNKPRVYPCKQCNSTFFKQSDLRSHIKLHCQIKSSLITKKHKKIVDRSSFSHKCSICEKTFKKPSQLKRHFRIHTGDRPFKCDVCERAFNQKGALQLHMVKHTGERPHKCTFCPATFSQRGNLRAHIGRVHTIPASGADNFSCSECSCVFKKLGSLNAHMSRMHFDPEILAAETAPSKLQSVKMNSATVQSAAGHTSQQVPISTQLPTSMPSDANMSNLPQSSMITTAATMDNDQMSYITSGPQEQIMMDNVTAGNHMTSLANSSITVAEAQTTNTLQQVETGLAVTSVVDSSTSQKQLQDVVQQILELSEQTSNPQIKQQHIQEMAETNKISSDIIHQALVNSGVEPVDIEQQAAGDRELASERSAEGQAIVNQNGAVSCEQEVKLQNAQGGLWKHIIRKVNGVRFHQCNYCVKEFKKPSDLVRHIRIHTHEKPFKCYLCFRAFAVKSTLTAHIKTHTGVKDFKCPICIKMFATQGSLKVHLRLHTGTKPFRCHFCDKSFRTSGHRKAHLASHIHQQGQSPRRPRRSMMKKPASNLDLERVPLQEPILITDTGLIRQAPKALRGFENFLGEISIDRPFRCAACERCFKKSSHLKQHIRSHTGERPYKCVQCMRSFSSTGVLKAHIRTHTGIKSFKCAICNSLFTTNGSLKRHMTTHSEVRPFMCPYCQKTFKTSVNCKKHMKTHRHELAMEALQMKQQQDSGGGDQVVEQEIAITSQDVQSQDVASQEVTSHEVMHDDIEEEEVDLLQQVTTDETETIVINQQPDGTFVQQHIQVTGDQSEEGQAAAAVISQMDENQTASIQLHQQHQSDFNAGQDVIQSEIISDALVSDTTLNTSIHQQVLEQPTVISGQSLISGNQVHYNQINISQGQAQVHPTVEMSNITSLGQMQQTINESLTNNSLTTIFQNRGDASEAVLTQAAALSSSLEMNSTLRKFKCTYCYKRFKKSSHLNQHIRSHTGERPHQCPTCSRTFVSMGVLRAHMKTHEGVKRFKCPLCIARFTTNGSLTRHLLIHSNDSPYKCNICSQNFRSRRLMRRHMLRHQEPNMTDNQEVGKAQRHSKTTIIQITEEQAEQLSKTKPVQTMSVSEKLLIESATEIDRISEVRSEEKQSTTFINQCPDCDKSFKKPSDLVRHLRIHTGEKPYACDVCERRFTVKSTLDSHKKTHDAGEKKFKCHVCTTKFSTKGSLKVHMRLHTGAKPFKCPQCEQCFRTSGHRQSHLKAHSQNYNADNKVKRQQQYVYDKGFPQSLKVVTTDGHQQIIASDDEFSRLNQLQASQNTQEELVAPGVVVPPTVDQNVSLLQNLPISFTVPETSLVTDNGVMATQMLQGLEGVQLQLAGNLTTNGQLQITGLDTNQLLGHTVPSNQTIQIDANLLQQLQQGNINLVANSGSVIPGTDQSNLLPMQVQQAVNPNIIIQPVASQGAVTHLDTQAGQSGQESKVEMLQGAMLGDMPDRTLQAVNTEPPVEDNEADDVDILDQVQASQKAGLSTMPNDQQSLFKVERLSNETVIKFHGDKKLLKLEDAMTIVENPEDPERIHACQICNKKFKRIGHLKDHIRVHVGQVASLAMAVVENPEDPERIHACQLCDKKFKRPGLLEDHIRVHVGQLTNLQPPTDKPKPHACTHCGKAFTKPSQLVRHVRIHTGERPFTCPVCKKAFNQKNALQIHMKQHSGEREYACPYCQHAFTQKGNLKTHIKRAHHVEMVNSMNLPATSSQAAIPTLNSSAATENEDSIDLELFQTQTLASHGLAGDQDM